MKKRIFVRYAMAAFAVVCAFILASCEGPLDGTDGDDDDPYAYSRPYNLIKIPVPAGGVTFPVGASDNTVARVESVYYMGETEVTYGLYRMVANWAENEKEGEKYQNLLDVKSSYNPSHDKDLPLSETTYLEIMVWCNAYTEWYNEQHGTIYTPVYVDSEGEPVRSAKKGYSPIYMRPTTIETNGTVEICFREYYDYIATYPTMKDYLLNGAVTGTGFRIPTPEEWELAARWQGADTVNAVTGVIGGKDFSKEPLKFTKGNSISGAHAYYGNLDEGNEYAVFEYNSDHKLAYPKTKKPNALGLYDMCGNLREFVYHVEYLEMNSAYDVWGDVIARDFYPFAQTRGGYFNDLYETLALGNSVYVDATAYNYYYGFRLCRND